jgi:hypothetical protein
MALPLNDTSMAVLRTDKTAGASIQKLVRLRFDAR